MDIRGANVRFISQAQKFNNSIFLALPRLLGIKKKMELTDT